MSVNAFFLSGTVAWEPEITAYGTGKNAKLTLNVDHKKYNKETGSWEQGTSPIEVEAYNSKFEQMADRCSQLTVGGTVIVSGRVQLDVWDDRNNPGKKRSRLKLVVEKLDPIQSAVDHNIKPLANRPQPLRQPEPEQPKQPEKQQPNLFQDIDNSGGNIPF